MQQLGVVSAKRFAMDAYLITHVVPKVLFSTAFSEQVKAVGEHLPEIPTKIRLVRKRNWGTDWSLSITPLFECDLDLIFPGKHPEVEACLSGPRVAQAYMESHYIEALGWTREAAEERMQKTTLLLDANPEELFSEVRCVPSTGKLVITDGYHRAGVRKALGFSTHNVMVTEKIHRT